MADTKYALISSVLSSALLALFRLLADSSLQELRRAWPGEYVPQPRQATACRTNRQHAPGSIHA